MILDATSLSHIERLVLLETPTPVVARHEHLFFYCSRTTRILLCATAAAGLVASCCRHCSQNLLGLHRNYLQLCAVWRVLMDPRGFPREKSWAATASHMGARDIQRKSTRGPTGARNITWDATRTPGSPGNCRATWGPTWEPACEPLYLTYCYDTLHMKGEIGIGF